MNHQSGWRLVTPPTEEIIDLSVAKEWVRAQNVDTDNDLIEFLVEVATGFVEARDHALGTQVWERLLDRFPYCEPLNLWKKPVQSVEFVKYTDTDGVLQTWDPAEYQTVLTSRVPCIVPAYSKTWPTTRCQPESVVVRFTAGYNSSPLQVPSLITGAMRTLIGHLYANRESVVVGNAAVVIPQSLEDLLDAVLGSPRVY